VKTDGEYVATRNERNIMHLLLSPVLASMIWIGGGGLGLVLVIVVVVLLLGR
jgi:cellobiose-specific phosphotransferase system component IIC